MTPEARAALVRKARLELKQYATTSDDALRAAFAGPKPRGNPGYEASARASIRRDSRSRFGVTAALRNLRAARKNPGLAESFGTTRDQAVVDAAKLRPTARIPRPPRARF